jgi:hypothetical protein
MLYLDIVNALDMNQQLGVVFPDIKSAFDILLADVIVRLKRINLPKIFQFSPTIWFPKDSYSSGYIPGTLHEWCPRQYHQPDSPCPLHVTCTVLQFADDIALYYSDSELSTISTKLRQDAGTINVLLGGRRTRTGSRHVSVLSLQ